MHTCIHTTYCVCFCCLFVNGFKVDMAQSLLKQNYPQLQMWHLPNYQVRLFSVDGSARKWSCPPSMQP